MRKIFLLFFIILKSFVGLCQSETDIDSNFNQGSWFDNQVRDLDLQSDNKIIAVGGFSLYNGISQNKIIRLNQDGTKDDSFNIGTGITSTAAWCLKVQTDGKILVGGRFTSFNGYIINSLVRLNSDGSFDDSFNSYFSPNVDVLCLALQADGKILCGGAFSMYNGISKNNIVRLNQNGSLDTTFNIGTGFNNQVKSISIQSDGKILCGGYFTTYNGISRNYFTRLNSSGSLDTSFNIGTGFNDWVNTIKILPNNKILVGGRFSGYNSSIQYGLVKLNSDGSRDTSFNIGTNGFFSGNYPNVTTTFGNVQSIVIQSDGKLLCGGFFAKVNNIDQYHLARLNSDGAYDSSFNVETKLYNGGIWKIISQTDGKILLGGSFLGYNNDYTNKKYLIRLNGTSNLSNYEFNNEKTLLYPNPANDKFTMDFGNDMITNYTVKINNMLGQEVYSNVINEPQFEVSKTWQGEGLYFVKIYNEKNILVGTKKIILQ
jgi:uncharacterized delta-60 repeat protein